MIYKVNDIVYLKFFLFHTKFKEVHFRGKNTKLWLEHLGQYKFKKKINNINGCNIFNILWMHEKSIPNIIKSG